MILRSMMMRSGPTYVPPLPTLQELIRDYKLGAKKRFAQNYLLNRAAIRKLVKCAGLLDNHHVCEVGPGPGGITRQVLSADIASLSVVELDKRFMPILQDLADVYEPHDKHMKIYHGDILDFNMAPMFPENIRHDWNEPPPFATIIGNLPFNISTPLITRWLKDISLRQGAWSIGRTRLILTFQKEVGERLNADILGNQRSRLSILSQYLCDVKLKYIIPGKVFVPPPKVDVAVVVFTPLKRPRINQPYELVNKVVRHVFHYRQKYCKRGIQTLFPKDLAHLADEMLLKSEIHPTTRPVQLSVGDFSRLCDQYSDICNRYPRLIDYYYRSQDASIQTFVETDRDLHLPDS